jgi:hypothetical protein
MAKSKPVRKGPSRPSTGGSYVRRDGKLQPRNPETPAAPAPAEPAKDKDN